jgi:hypothetical protein
MRKGIFAMLLSGMLLTSCGGNSSTSDIDVDIIENPHSAAGYERISGYRKIFFYRK